jgi:hypothetical protein
VSTEPKIRGILAAQPRIRIRLSEDTLAAVEAELPPGGTVEDEARLLLLQGLAAPDAGTGRSGGCVTAPEGP